MSAELARKALLLRFRQERPGCLRHSGKARRDQAGPAPGCLPRARRRTELAVKLPSAARSTGIDAEAAAGRLEDGCAPSATTRFVPFGKASIIMLKRMAASDAADRGKPKRGIGARGRRQVRIEAGNEFILAHPGIRRARRKIMRPSRRGRRRLSRSKVLCGRRVSMRRALDQVKAAAPVAHIHVNDVAETGMLSEDPSRRPSPQGCQKRSPSTNA